MYARARSGARNFLRGVALPPTVIRHQKSEHHETQFRSTKATPGAQHGIILNVMKKSHFRFNVVFRPEPEGGFTALVPALPGCVTYGRTLDEAREMVRDAVRGYIESLRKHKEPIPSDEDTLVASLELEDVQASHR